MGGCFQHETFKTIEQLLAYVENQIRAANEAGLYLLQAEIKQKSLSEKGFEWTAYFSK